jgi:hypothetical protein
MKRAYKTNAVSQGAKSVSRVRCVHPERVIQFEAKLHEESGLGSSQRPKPEKVAFPAPRNVKEQGFFCDSDRVLVLYNKCHGGTQKKVTRPVRNWFEHEALQAGWAQAMFLADIKASRSAGCMLLATALTEVSNVINH